MKTTRRESELSTKINKEAEKQNQNNDKKRQEAHERIKKYEEESKGETAEAGQRGRKERNATHDKTTRGQPDTRIPRKILQHDKCSPLIREGAKGPS